LKYVNIFQGDFIMALNLFGSILKQVFGAGTSQQPATIQRTEAEQKPATALEQVNAAVRETNLQGLNQLHAKPNKIETVPSTAAITPEVLPNQIVPLATNQQGVELKVSSEVLGSLKSTFLKAVNNLPILATVYNGIKNGEISLTDDSALKPILPLIRDFLKSGVLDISTGDVNKLLSSIFKNPNLNLTPAIPQSTTAPNPA
jgi:hypothetical protein